MTDQNIKDTFEAFFEKYKKTEGDETSWSAHWTTRAPAGTFEINMTKCPRGTVFKVFANGKRQPDIVGWDDFLKQLDNLEQTWPDLFDRERFFAEMQEMI
ncbi:MAG TPA: hypothetical protein VJ934_10490 [Desulfomicrobiaceae bacterium]|nr:hypothetical protein [Desulfomicrobiaceae bacterium]